MYWPDLITLRRIALPVLERNERRLFGRDIMFSKPLQTRGFAGVVLEATVDDVRRQLLNVDNVYPVNTATLKYHETSEGRAYEAGTYALRPEGFLGEIQYHFRLWPHVDGVGISAHRELNPWRRPRDHYAGVDWHVGPGVEKAYELLDIDRSKSVDGIRPR
ncbi:hypothetical protein [Haloarcula onubensis]|uniref:DUF2071 domain-containing protein n=1 Tax=Haloarcula onubensis TaxID=2950539 RepID=A0ABU2FV90_9EURY|nr:hypothetical protein [Halomicroarcula sp. S3CR25-11]MDS0284686.1 hypothetical protein [Halomicroarcula sp. S3CR25-11]